MGGEWRGGGGDEAEGRWGGGRKEGGGGGGKGGGRWGWERRGRGREGGGEGGVGGGGGGRRGGGGGGGRMGEGGWEREDGRGRNRCLWREGCNVDIGLRSPGPVGPAWALCRAAPRGPVGLRLIPAAWRQTNPSLLHGARLIPACRIEPHKPHPPAHRLTTPILPPLTKLLVSCPHFSNTS